jgi:hypothetical protein
MSIPKWAKADPDITNTATTTNAVTYFFFIVSSLFFGAAKKNKPQASGVSVTPSLRGLTLLI